MSAKASCSWAAPLPQLQILYAASVPAGLTGQHRPQTSFSWPPWVMETSCFPSISPPRLHFQTASYKPKAHRTPLAISFGVSKSSPSVLDVLSQPGSCLPSIHPLKKQIPHGKMGKNIASPSGSLGVLACLLLGRGQLRCSGRSLV